MVGEDLGQGSSWVAGHIPSTIPIWSYWLLFVLATGLIVVASAASDSGLCTFAAASAVDAKQAPSCMEFWFNRYQTLAAGLFALVAAYTASRSVSGQIVAADRAAEQKRKRDEFAARAYLPIALGDICAFVEQCAAAIRHARDTGEGLVSLPPFPTVSLVSVRDSIAVAPQAQQNALARLISMVQIFRSRYPEGVTVRGVAIGQCELDAARLLTLAERNFPYARNGTESLKDDMTKDELRHALIVLGLPERENTPVSWFLGLPDDEEENDLGFVVDETELEE